jgi:hypothetical protein
MLDAPIMQELALLPAGQLQFRLFVQEEYDDNVNLVAQGRESDFITRISPTVAVNRTTGTTSLNLRYAPTFLLYAQFPELNRTDHTLVFDGSWQATPRLRLSLQDSLLITQNVVGEISPLGISETGRNQTTQNTLSPALDLKLTSRSNLALRYTNLFIDQEEGEDRTINGGTITFGHSLARGGVNLAYNIAYVDRERASNSLSHQGTVRTSWRLNPKDVLSFSAVASFVDNDEGDNTAVLGGSVGLNHQFNPRLSGTLTGGIQGFGLQGGENRPAFTTNSNLAWTFPRGSLTLAVANGFQNTFTTVDDVGTVLDTRGTATFSYQAGPGLNLSVTGSYSRVEFQEEDQTDLIGRLGINIRYQLGNLSLNAGYNFFDRNSDGGTDLTSNRVFIGLSVGYSTPLPF